MKDAQKPDHISLSTLVTHLKEGRFAIPDFQRDFEWKPNDVSNLIRSVFLDYYIGSMLLWKGKRENFEALACEPLYGYQGSDSKREHIVLDGQQRLTALYYAFIGPDKPLPNRRNRYLYFIRVDLFEQAADEDAFVYDWTRAGPKLLADRAAQYERHMFPLSVIGEGYMGLPNWVQGYEKYWSGKHAEAKELGDEDAAEQAAVYRNNAQHFGEHLFQLMNQYQVAYIELDRDLELRKVCDIFTQINSRGIQLDVFDLMNALLKPRGLQLKHLWRKAEPRLSFVDSSRLNIYVLQVMSILEQAYCSPKYLYYLLPGEQKLVRDSEGKRKNEILVPSVEDFEKRWRRAVNALEVAINLLRHPQEFGVTSARYLPYVSILPAFASLEAFVDELPPGKKLEAQRKIRLWYWASVFTNRYSGSVESTSARDYLDICRWIEEEDLEPALIQDFKHRFRNLELRKETRRGSSIYNGVFNLLVLQGARDWITGNVPQHDNLDDHHIVPRSWAQKNLGDNMADSILNRTALSSESNRQVIADRLPNEYLPEMIASNGEERVREMLRSHSISDKALAILLRDPFGPNDFEAFLAERQRTIQEAIENLLIKQRQDLPPAVRHLDEQVENVELELREHVKLALDNDPGRLPQHIANKVDERLQKAFKKNAAMDAEHYGDLAGQLEYFDLRELQETMMNKALWPLFESRFRSKEQLVARFDKLAELRNAIRHSRKVDAITRKDGEAAIMWFSNVLENERSPVAPALKTG